MVVSGVWSDVDSLIATGLPCLVEDTFGGIDFSSGECLLFTHLESGYAILSAVGASVVGSCERLCKVLIPVVAWISLMGRYALLENQIPS